jgi:hypothetical protein
MAQHGRSEVQYQLFSTTVVIRVKKIGSDSF